MLNINIWKVISIKHDTDTIRTCEHLSNISNLIRTQAVRVSVGWTFVKHIKFNPDTSVRASVISNIWQGIGMLDRVISDLHHQPQFFSDSKIHPLASEQGNLSCASQHNTHTLCQFTWCKTLHMLGCDLLYLVNYPSIRSCCMHVSLT